MPFMLPANWSASLHQGSWDHWETKKMPPGALRAPGGIRLFSYHIFCGSEAVYVLTVLAHEVNVITPAILEKCTDLVHEILLPVSPS